MTTYARKQLLSAFKNLITFNNNDRLYVERYNAPAGENELSVNFGTLALAVAVANGLVKESFTIIGNDSDIDFVITHNKDDVEKKVIVQVFKLFGDGAFIDPEIENTDKDNVTVKFSIAPLTGEDYAVFVL